MVDVSYAYSLISASRYL